MTTIGDLYRVSYTCKYGKCNHVGDTEHWCYSCQIDHWHDYYRKYLRTSIIIIAPTISLGKTFVRKQKWNIKECQIYSTYDPSCNSIRGQSFGPECKVYLLSVTNWNIVRANIIPAFQGCQVYSVYLVII